MPMTDDVPLPKMQNMPQGRYGYAADQMRAYGDARAAAATERAAKVCDDRTPSVDDYSDQRDFAIRGALRDLAAAIRGS